jgi:hypothetical protein
MRSKSTGENGRFSDDQYTLHYIYGYLKGNAQHQIQPYIHTDKIWLDNVEALIKILEAAFRDHDEVGMASTELDRLTQGNCKFSIYSVEFQRLKAILEYNSKAKKATVK